MQLDADENDEAPFFKPAVVQTEPLRPKGRDSQPMAVQEGDRTEEGIPDENRDKAHENAAAAATATAEEEE